MVDANVTGVGSSIGNGDNHVAPKLMLHINPPPLLARALQVGIDKRPAAACLGKQAQSTAYRSIETSAVPSNREWIGQRRNPGRGIAGLPSLAEVGACDIGCCSAEPGLIGGEVLSIQGVEVNDVARSQHGCRDNLPGDAETRKPHQLSGQEAIPRPVHAGVERSTEYAACRRGKLRDWVLSVCGLRRHRDRKTPGCIKTP